MECACKEVAIVGMENMAGHDLDTEFVLSKENMPIVKQMAEKIPGGFFVYRADEEQRLIFANRRVLEMFGCDTWEEFSELTGGTFQGMVHPEDYEMIQASIDFQIMGSHGENLDYVVYRIIRRDGTVRWVDDYGHYSQSPDITDKHEAEEENKRRAEVIAGLSIDYDAIYLLDLETGEMHPYRMKRSRYEDVRNALSEDGEQVTWHDMITAYAERYILPGDRVFFLAESSERHIKSRLKREKSYMVSYQMRDIDGGMRYIQMSIVRIGGKHFNNHAVVGYRDITGHVEKAKKTSGSIKSEQDLRVDQARQEFLQRLSQEIRAPLGSMTSFSRLAQKHIGEPLLACEYLDKVDESRRNLLALIDGLLASEGAPDIR